MGGAGVDEMSVLDLATAGRSLVHALAGSTEAHVHGARLRAAAAGPDRLHDALTVGAVDEIGGLRPANQVRGFVGSVPGQAAVTGAQQIAVPVVRVHRPGVDLTERVRAGCCMPARHPVPYLYVLPALVVRLPISLKL